MRQNMEEMNATQEEIQRKESSYIAEIEYLKTVSAIVEVNAKKAVITDSPFYILKKKYYCTTNVVCIVA